METLLTPTESLAFQSFLTAVDGCQPSSDWATYSSQFTPHRIHRHDSPDPPENESLTKATKELMSLDAGGWSGKSMMPTHTQNQHPHHQQHLMYDHQTQHHQQQTHSQRQHPYSSAHEPFPFLNPKGTPPHYQEQYNQQYTHQPQNLNISTAPTDHYNSHSPGPIRNKSVSKRPIRPSATRSSSSSTASSSTTTRQRGPSQQQPQAQTSPSEPSLPLNSVGQGATKPALLSPSQKKANHIQSEQKRRANIRRGYEALCETVPALRDAIREEEEDMRQGPVHKGSATTNGAAKGKAVGKKRATKKKDGEDGSLRDRTDGRAGPRSENVVLSKSIDYINDLLSERSTLLGRLHRARSLLPPGHPCLIPLSQNPPWEREWKGGDGQFGDEEEEAEESEGEGEIEVEEDTGRSQPRSRPRRNGASSNAG